MKRSQKVLLPIYLLSVFLIFSSCDLFGFGKESLLEPEAFTPFAIEGDWFALQIDGLATPMTVYVIDVGNDTVAGSIQFKCLRGWGTPGTARVIKDRIYVCSGGMPGDPPPREVWSITPSTGTSKRIALPYPLCDDPVYLPKANKVVVHYTVDPSPITVIDFDTDTVTQNSPVVDAIDSIFEATDGTVYGVSKTYFDPTFARINLDPFTVTGLTPARSQADGRLRGKAAIELPNGNIVINNARATETQINAFNPAENKIVKNLVFTYNGVTIHENNKKPFCLQMYTTGNVMLVGHGYGIENDWEAAISIHDPETLEIKGWITGEYVTPSFYVRRDKLYCVGSSHIYVRDLKAAGYPLIKTIELK